MLIGYGDFTITWAISGSASGSAFLAPTDGSNLTDGRTGSVQSCRWIGGTQNTSSYVDLTGTITSPYDSGTPAIGVVGVANVTGLPLGTLISVGASQQRLVRGERRELSAWLLPLTNGSSVVIRIHNNVNGVASIAANATFSLGELFVGRVIQVPTVVTNNPQNDENDPTQFNRSAGGQLYQVMRKPWRSLNRSIGPYNIRDTFGGTAGTIPDGGHTAGTMDLSTLRSLLLTSPLIAVCSPEAATTNASGNVTSGGITYNQDFMQTNWFCARLSQPGQITDDKPPFWSWAPQFMEAT